MTTKTCQCCETTQSPEWWTREYNGQTVIHCTGCAAKGDEMEMLDAVIMLDWTTYRLAA